MTKYSDKEKILKATKEDNHIQRKPLKITDRFFSRNLPSQEIVA